MKNENQLPISSRNRALYEKIKGQLVLEYLPNEDWRAQAWHSHVKENKACIYYCECDNPEAALTHELLHIELHLQGYTGLRFGYSPNQELHMALPSFVKIVDALLQHQKMATRFIELGYTEEEFYLDPFPGNTSYFRSELEEQEADEDNFSHKGLGLFFLEFLGPFRFTKEVSTELRNSFASLNAAKHAGYFEQIERLVEEWNASSSLDARSTVEKLAKTLGFGPCWLSEYPEQFFHLENHFPQDGFFVGEPFTLT